MLCEESETFEDDWDKNHKIKVVIFNNCVKIISNYELFPAAYLSPEEAIRLGRFLTSKICTGGGGDDIINKGLEEWDKLVQMDEEADREEKARQNESN